jgi:plasmid stabilization system protein ParE
MDDQPPLTLVYARATQGEFNEIRKQNQKTYGKEHAAEYIDFLLTGIEALVTDPEQGKPVEKFPPV